MRIKTALLFLISFVLYVSGISQTMTEKVNNYTTFTSTPTDITKELLNLVPEEFHNHPEFGMLPYNAPCTNCIELIHLRTDSTRMFVEKGSEGTQFYSQASYGYIHYRDEQGYLRTYDQRVIPDAHHPGKFLSIHQDFPMVIDTENKLTSFILPSGEIISMNRNLKLYHDSGTGTITQLGNANWSDYTAGDDGVYIKNAWPGIDIEIRSGHGELKTSYILNSNPGFTSGHLVIEDEFQGGSDYNLVMDEIWSVEPGTGAQTGTAKYLNSNHEGVYLSAAFGYDHSGIRDNSATFGYKIISNKLQIYVPEIWMNNPAAQYPLVIDPVVTSSATYSAGIMRFRYDGSFCFGAGVDCGYTLSVPRPANSTLTAANFSIVHQTLAGSCFFSCWMSDAGFYFQTTCGTDGYWGCNTNNPGTCTGTNLDISGLIACLGPACNGNVDFTIYNSYCYCATGGDCNPSCQRINNNTWIVTLTGSTIETLGNTATGNGSQTLNDPDCVGSFTLDPTAANGVPGYTYSWSTGATTPTISVGVTPAVYTCTVTDACGSSVLATFNIGCPLPLRFENFTAVQQNQEIIINWNTLSEAGIQKINLQRAGADGIYKTITSFLSDGTETGKEYSFTDLYPSQGNNYYRLVAYFESGESSTEEPISAFYSAEKSLLIVPNPASDEVRISFESVAGQSYTIVISDSFGRTVKEYLITANASSSEILLDISSWTKGNYVIKLESQNKTLTERLVVF